MILLYKQIGSLVSILYVFACSFFVALPFPETGVSCGVASGGGEICCEWEYVVDRYCCDADDTLCEDDCSDEERSDDRANTLWGMESHCVEMGTCKWVFNGDGMISPPLDK